MKKCSYLILAAVLVLTSCVSRHSADMLQGQRDSLAMVVAQKDSLINGIFNDINAITENLTAIKSRENIIRIDNNELQKTQTAQISDDIAAIDQLLQDNRSRIAALEKSAAQLHRANVKIAGLQKTISLLNSQVAAKDGEIAELKDNLKKMGAQVETLNTEVSNQRKQVENLSAAKSNLEAEVSDKTAKLNTAYYIVESQKSLIDAKIIRKKGFIGRTMILCDGCSLSNFMCADIRTLKEIPIGHKDVVLVTSHPSDSYTLVKGKGDVVESLVIDDADQFWRSSKILVVSYK